jgi:hypothetical protein
MATSGSATTPYGESELEATKCPNDGSEYLNARDPFQPGNLKLPTGGRGQAFRLRSHAWHTFCLSVGLGYAGAARDGNCRGIEVATMDGPCVDEGRVVSAQPATLESANGSRGSAAAMAK